MKGLELCQDFFETIGLPTIKEKVPECLPYIAAGMSGGSQCHGNDDEVSRDHGWGAGFCIWLLPEHHELYSKKLEDIFEHLPLEYRGFHRQPVVVCEINSYVRSVVGRENPPERDFGWLYIPEESLFEITRRPVFYDGTGEITGRFGSFRSYPVDVWKKRLSACIAWLWEWGIKHLKRAEMRGDLITASMYWCRFATYAMKGSFLLNHTYAPYHKWLYKEFLKLSRLSDEIAPKIDEGFTRREDRYALCVEITGIISEALRELNYHPVASKKAGVAYPENELLRYAKGIQNSIEDLKIREMRLYGEILLPPSKLTWAAAFPQRI